jgi:hypothetical protein
MWQRLTGYQSMDVQRPSGNDWSPSSSCYTMPAKKRSEYAGNTQVSFRLVMLFVELCFHYLNLREARGSVVVKAVYYKPEGLWFENR